MADSSYNFLEGGGEMGALMRAKNWAETPVGPVEKWPQSLKTAVRMLLDTPFPMYIAWGNDYTQFYNDGYRPILGATKHPQALGGSSRETFSEIWHIIGDMFDGVMDGKAVGFPDFMLPLDRNGYLEECYFDFSYSPLRYPDGEVGGVLVTVIETTATKKSQKSLVESKNELEFAINAAELGTWDLNPRTNVFVGNERLKKWFGLSGEDEIGLDHALNTIADSDRRGVTEAIKMALDPASGGSYEISYSIQNSLNGQERRVLAKGKALFDDDGQPYRFSGTLQDITKDYIAQKAVERSQQNFKSLVIHSPVAMCILRGEDYVVDVANERMFELWGKSSEEVLNKPLFEGLPEVKEQGIEALLEKVYTTGKQFVAHEHSINLPRNGAIETVYVDFVYEALHDVNGEVSAIAVVAINVTEQVNSRHIVEAAEERARLAIDAANMGTFDVNLKTGELIASERFDEIFGVNHSLQQKDYVDRIHPDDRTLREAAHEEAKGTGRLFYVARLQKPDQGIRWMRAEGTILYDKDKQPYRLLGTVLDVTEQRQLEQQKDDFIGIASHELKTPLTSLKASFQFLSRIVKTDPTSPKLPVLVEQSTQSLGKLNRLIEDLLNVTKIDEGYLALRKAPMVISEVIDSCCIHVKMSGTHDINVVGDLQLEVVADKERIDQVLSNLVNNAVKYAPESREIVIRIERVMGFAKVSVTDKGKGIPQDKISHLFHRYYRIEDKTNFSGLGLGLYISSEIVKRHQGQIGVESESGRGSTFWFTLPLEQS
ncbi:MAG: domain S-box protein [Sphingobacteriaceae bacterium]|jgi:PAS domain S-box-containing protein|nr:domain S-box protein [Sphingobacteriaceae bacterium]